MRALRRRSLRVSMLAKPHRIRTGLRDMRSMNKHKAFKVTITTTAIVTAKEVAKEYSIKEEQVNESAVLSYADWIGLNRGPENGGKELPVHETVKTKTDVVRCVKVQI